MSVQLSEHFSLAELTVTNTGLDNTPSAAQVRLLTNLALFGEKIRTRALDDKPMNIDSAFRSPLVNAAVGGVPTSAHQLCFAMDFTAEEFGTPFQCAEAISACGDLPMKDPRKLIFDQVIYEQNAGGAVLDWCHVSRDPRARMERWTRLPNGSYIKGLHPR